MKPTVQNEANLAPDRRVAVVCPECKQGYKVAARLLGRRMVCRHCRTEFRAVEKDSNGAKAAVVAKSEPPSDSGKAVLPGDALPSAGSRSIAIDTSWAGQILGRYKVLSILGQGGMGVVWRGHDDKLKRDVALKILTKTNKDKGSGHIGGLSADLFMQEARAVAKLQHPAVVSIFEVAEDQGQVFLALELMEGGTLKEFVERMGPIPPRQLFDWMVGPVKALALAHKRGIIHRDVKPGNLMFDDHGHLKLMDFGLADVSHEETSAKLRGKAVGSLGWIAPETARGKNTTPLSDIYSMGLVLLYAMRGRPWIHADSRSKLVAMHQNPPAPDFSGIKGLTAKGQEVLRRCLAVEPSERYQSADELVAAIKLCADEDPVMRSRERVSHAGIAICGAVIGVLLGIAAVLYYFLNLNDKLDQMRQPAIQFPDRPASPDAAPAEETKPKSEPAPKPTAAASSEQKFATLEEAKVPWPQVPNLVDPAKVQFVGTKNGAVFHSAASDCGRSVFASNLVIYESAEKAVAAGRRPCPRCKPAPQAHADVVLGNDE
ncbi:MAG TPA: protein kinase [Phycisphaerae bacterium]|nr:protein kinase [Phycisphaerae bacterium]